MKFELFKSSLNLVALNFVILAMQQRKISLKKGDD